jgi:recombination protein RecA
MGKRTPASTNTPAAHAAMTDAMLVDMQDSMNGYYGNDASQVLSSASTLSHIDHSTSTGSMIVDKVITGGRPTPCSLLPFGRQTEISGLPGTGKTTLLAHLAAEVQSKGGFVVMTDTEERIDHPYWQKLGVNTDKILNLRARTLEEVFDRQLKFIQTTMKKWPDIPILMGWDSLGGTSTDSIWNELDAKDGAMEAAKKIMMTKAKLISSGMEILNPFIAKSKIAYVYTNTLYMKPNVKYGDPWVTPGGVKKDFFATLRLRLEKRKAISEEDAHTGKITTIGHKVAVCAIKNSMAPMLVELEAAVLGNKGYSNDYTVFEMGVALKVISQNKSWYTWTTPLGEEVKFQGANGFFDVVPMHAEYPDLVQQVADAL